MPVPRLVITVAMIFALSGCAQSPVDKVKTTMMLKAQADNLYNKRECVKAIPLYQQLIDEMPKHAESWVKVGNCRVFQNELNSAVEAYQQALLIESSHAKAWYNLVQIQAKILGETVAQMYRQVDKGDPLAIEARHFALNILEQFNTAGKARDGGRKNTVTTPDKIQIVTPVEIQQDRKIANPVQSEPVIVPVDYRLFSVPNINEQ